MKDPIYIDYRIRYVDGKAIVTPVRKLKGLRIALPPFTVDMSLNSEEREQVFEAWRKVHNPLSRDEETTTEE